MSFSVYLSTLGCPKNRVDSEKALWALQNAGAHITLDEGEADILLVNTCGFVNDAKEESINRVLELAQIKQERPGVKLMVMGCLSERYREELAREIPEIDMMFGVHELGKVVQAMEKGRTRNNPLDPEELSGRILTTPKGWAYLKIAEGCSNTCSFCAIPAIRGPYASRGRDVILREAMELAAKGVKELNLVAQDTTLYGADLKIKAGLSGLIRELAEIDGITWIRLMYMYPPLLDDGLLETMAATEKVVPYLDIPLQHASDKILSRMNRKETAKSILELVERIRSSIPDAAIRSAFIVGFPGETEDDFTQLLRFMEQARLDHVGAFIYSPEEGTEAEKLTGRTPRHVAQERLERLMQAQKAISKERLRRFQGKSLDILVEGFDPEDNLLTGRTAWQAPEVDGCVILDRTEAQPGEFLRLTVTGATEYDLIASQEPDI